jgi:hypothetical protein
VNSKIIVDAEKMRAMFAAVASIGSEKTLTKKTL